jgi:hypothetical protein
VILYIKSVGESTEKSLKRKKFFIFNVFSLKRKKFLMSKVFSADFFIAKKLGQKVLRFELFAPAVSFFL